MCQLRVIRFRGYGPVRVAVVVLCGYGPSYVVGHQRCSIVEAENVNVQKAQTKLTWPHS